MPKTKISEWSSTPANNTDIDSINIAEGCAPSGINDAIRELMAQVKDLYAGTSGDTIAVAGGGTGVGTLTGIVKGNGTSAFTAVTAPTGAIVGTTDTQTLTNKTLTAPTIASANLTTALTLTGAAGTSGQVLTSAGSGAAPTWTTASGGGSAATPTALGTVYGKTDTSSVTFLGYQAGNANTGVNNTAVGYRSLITNIGGASNTALGHDSAYSNTTGGFNVALGRSALYTNSTGSNNTSVGFESLGFCTSGSNTAVGYQSLYANTTGSNNSALGYGSLKGVTTGYGNVGIGLNAASALTTGVENVVIGYPQGFGGWGLSTGSNNVFIGARAGEVLTTGDRNICLGYYANPSANNGTQQIVIGTNYGSTGKGNNTGFIDPNGGGNYQGNNSASWSTTSDQRLKKNIVNNNVGLEKLTQIQVRNFEYRVKDEITELPTHCAIKKEGVQLGVIAQELQTILPECVKQESTGVLSVDPDNLTWYMINAIKELKAEFDAYKASHP
jgi:hypothetical protein